MANIIAAASEIVVYANHIMTLRNQTIAQMRPKESSTARYQNMITHLKSPYVLMLLKVKFGDRHKKQLHPTQAIKVLVPHFGTQ